jgi:hypothetical protein
LPLEGHAPLETGTLRGGTQAEIRGISLLKGWLSPEQLAQYESYRYFDVIGRQSGKRYRIRYGTGMNI